MKTKKERKNEDKRIDRFISIICIIIILSFGIIIYNKLTQEKPSKFLSKTTDLIQDNDLQQYESFLHDHVKKIKNKGLKKAIYNRIGLINISLENYQKALDAYKKAYNLAPNDPEICSNIGLVLIYLNQYDEALKYLNKAKSIDSKIPQLYNNLGIIFINKQKIPKAIANFKKAIEIDPKFYRAYTNLASAYVRLKNYQKAKDCINQALKEGANKSPKFKQLIDDQLKTLEKLEKE